MRAEHAKNTAWALLESALRAALGLTVGAWAARHLGSEGLGAVSYALAVAGLAQGAASLGTDGVLIRELARDPRSENRLLGSALAVQAAGAAAAFCGACLYAALGPHGRAQAPLVAVAASSLLFNVTLIDCLFQSRAQHRVSAAARLPGLLFGAACKAALVLLGLPAAWFVAATAAEAAVVACCLLLAYLRRGGSPLRWRARRGTVGALLREGRPLLLAAGAATVHARTDQLMLGSILGPGPAGVHAAATAVSSSVLAFLLSVLSFLFPSMVRAKAAGGEAYRRRTQRVSDAALLASLGTAAALALLSGPVVRALYGDGFAESARTLAVHAFAAPLVLAGAVRGYHILNDVPVRYETALQGGSALANVALGAVLIPRHGAVGAAWATVLANACSLLLGGLLLKRMRPHLWTTLRSLRLLLPVPPRRRRR